MSDTPQTDELARGNHVVPTEFAQDLERKCNEWSKCAEELKRYLWERIDYDDGVYLDWEAEAITKFNKLKGFANS